MVHRVEMQFSTEGGLRMIGRYPWELLRTSGDQLWLTGKYLSVNAVQNGASSYSRRHGIKLWASKISESEVLIVRMPDPIKPEPATPTV